MSSLVSLPQEGPKNTLKLVSVKQDTPAPDRLRVKALAFTIAFVWLLLVGAGVLLAPWFPGMFKFVVFLAGPSAVVVLLAAVLQFRIFGPITAQCLLMFRQRCWFSFNSASWDFIVLCSFSIAMLLIPIRDWLHSSMHHYYERSLQLAFFDEGKDWQVRDLRENIYCPLFIYTATANDFKRPGDRKRISEISFSSLHTGGEQTGYVYSPSCRSLVKCTALGSAATDALVLGISDQLKYRFWLEALNLKMGDFILFHPGEGLRSALRWMKRVLSCLQEGEPRQAAKVMRLLTRIGRIDVELPITWLFVRMPSLLLNLVSFSLMFAAYLNSRGSPDCVRARNLFLAGVFLQFGLYTLSFFGFVFQFLSVSIGLRQIHLATRSCQMSERPPAMIYVTDGGVQDCTGLMQLMRRRCKCILLILSFDDPRGELAQLRVAMDLAIQQGLGWFYDPKDPRRSFKLTLDELKREDFNETFFRLGIRYGWEMEPSFEPHAVLLIVKNRLPLNYDTKIKSYVTEAEVLGENISELRPLSRGWTHLAQTDLGGCCCNCCHLRGCNCGDKFPHNFTGFQCLTSQHFNSLCRLGYFLSADVVQELSRDCNGGRSINDCMTVPGGRAV